MQVRVCRGGELVVALAETHVERSPKVRLPGLPGPVAELRPAHERLSAQVRPRGVRGHARHLRDDRVGPGEVGGLGHRVDGVDGAVDVCPAQLDGGPERFEDGDGLLGVGHRLGASTEPPHHGVQPAQVVALTKSVSEVVPELDCALPGGRGLLPRVDEAKLESEAVEQLSLSARVDAGAAADRPVVLGRRLAVGALGRCGIPGPAGVVEGQVVGATVLGVVGQPGVVLAAAAEQLLEDGAMGRRSAVRRNGLVDGAPGDVVPEPQT
jgi:hypothetical protein